MKCSTLQSRLLALPDPSRVPEALQVHLNACPTCHAWHRALVQLEAALAALPVPPSDGQAKAALLRKFLSPPETAPVALPFRAATARPQAASTPASPLRAFAERYWPAAAIAATLLIATIAFFSVGHKPQEVAQKLPPDPLLARLVQYNLTLANADSAEKRVDTLSREAADLHREMVDLAMIDSGDGLTKLNQLYVKVVNDIAAEHATELHGPQGDKILERIAAQLAQEGQTANELAVERQVPPHAVGPLQEAAKIARQRSRDIQQIRLLGRT
jgi:hypothetical protein